MGIFLESNIGKISGQVVYLASGFNSVAANIDISGVTSSVSGQTVWIADTSGGGIETVDIGGERYVRALISGQPITANVNVAANVSGNIVYLTSGKNAVQISGQTITIGGTPTIQGTVNTSVSGNTINVGNAVSVRTTSGFNAVEVSGQIIYLTSGQNLIQINTQGGNIAGGAMTSDITPSTTVGLVARASMYGFDSTTSSFSRVRVTESGSPSAGNGVDFRLKTSLWSGDFNAMSGKPVSISGQTVVSEISGQTINVAGGVNVSGSNIRIQAFDPSGNVWRDAWVERSGGNRIIVDSQLSSVASGLSLTPALSGLTMELSGAFDARISGQTVIAQISGQTVVGNFTANVSGQVVNIAGQSVSVSGNVVRAETSGQLQRLQAFDPSGSTWRDIWVNQSGGNKLLVEATVNTTTNVSGNTIYLTSGFNPVQISGQTVVVGGTVTIAGAVTTSISGNYVSTSGSAVIISGQRVQTSGDAAIISGQTIVAELKVQNQAEDAIINVKEYRSGSKGVLVGGFVPTRLKSYTILNATAASGGTALDSGICKRVTLRNISQTSGAVVIVGFSGTNNSPFATSAVAGRGFALRDGDGMTVETTNPAFVRIVSVVSGQPISYFSVGDI